VVAKVFFVFPRYGFGEFEELYQLVIRYNMYMFLISTIYIIYI
jgi:hypothetical protein